MFIITKAKYVKLCKALVCKLLSVSDSAVKVLTGKIAYSNIDYRRTGILRLLAVVFWTVIPSRLFVSKKHEEGGKTLLCLDKVHFNDVLKVSNVRDLFANERNAVVHNLDAKNAVSVFEALKVVSMSITILFVYGLLPKESRELLCKVFLKRVKAWISYQRILVENPKKVILVGKSYDLRRFFLAYWLRSNRCIDSAFYINRPFMNRYDDIISNEIILSNQWAYQIRDRLHAKLIYNKITYLHNLYYPAIEKRSVKNTKARKNRVAFYMSGAYMRQKIGFATEAFTRNEVLREAKVIELLRRYATTYPQLEFVIFPHPNVETEDSARHHYKNLLILENISIRPPGKSSAELYDEYELGISSGSNTTFERLESGHKGLFVYPSNSMLVYKESSLAPVVFVDASKDLEKIEYLRKIDHNRFFSLIGVGNSELAIQEMDNPPVSG